MNKLSNKEFLKRFNKVNKHNIKVIEEYNGLDNKILCECEKGHKWKVLPSNLLKGSGCPYCSGHKTTDNNRFSILRPDLVKYFKNPEDAYNNSIKSKKKVILKCPICGNEQEVVLSNFSKQIDFSCLQCGKTISYPNKFIRAIIHYKKEIVDFYKFEYSAEWSDKRKYDLYFEFQNKKYIVELHGEIHKTNKWKGKYIRNQKENDEYKKKLALENGIDFYIEIDASDNDLNKLMENFNKTILKDIFNITQKELIFIQEKIQTSLFNEVIKRYNNGEKVIDIAKDLDLNKTTVYNYTKKGRQLGLCEYRNRRTNKNKQ